MRHEIMQLLLFVVDKVDTCVCLDIDELLLIGPEIEHLVPQKIQTRSYRVHEKYLHIFEIWMKDIARNSISTSA